MRWQVLRGGSLTGLTPGPRGSYPDPKSGAVQTPSRMEAVTGRQQQPVWLCCHLMRAEGQRVKQGQEASSSRAPPGSPGSSADVS